MRNVEEIVAQEAWATLEELRHLEDIIRLMPADSLQAVSLEALRATISLLEFGLEASGVRAGQALEQPWWVDWQAHPPAP